MQSASRPAPQRAWRRESTVLERIARHSYLAVGAAALVVATASCGPVLGALGDGPKTAATVPLTVKVTPSMMVAVLGPAGMDQLLHRVVAATARPREDLEVLGADARGRALVAANSPGPAQVTVAGRPVAPGRGASSFQLAQYQHAMTRWRAELAAGRRAVAKRTRSTVVHWMQSLRWPVAGTEPADASAASLPRECAAAADVITGQVDQAGSRADHRVVLLSVSTLGGRPPAGELDGDDVIVLTSYLPSAAASSAAQLNLLNAGASFAAVLGPEATPSQLEHLVSESLSRRTVSEVVSGRALFANNSAVLRPDAARVLAPVVTGLRRPGATAVVNGFASTPGSSHHNQVLSQDRASAVARYLESRGVPRSSLLAVGHGATNLVAPGPSGGNRRVVVVIEEPGP